MSSSNETERLRIGGRPRLRQPALCDLQARELARKLFTGRDYQMFVLRHWGQGDEGAYTVAKLCGRLSPKITPGQCNKILRRLQDTYDAAEAQIIAHAVPVTTLGFTTQSLIRDRFTVILERGDMAMATDDVTPQEALGRELNRITRHAERRINARLQAFEGKEAA